MQHDEDKGPARRAAKIRERDELYKRKALQYLLASPEGQTLVWWLLEIGFIGRQPFVPGDQSASTFNMGQLNIGQQVERLILEASPSGFVKLMETMNDRRSNDRDYINGSASGDLFDGDDDDSGSDD